QRECLTKRQVGPHRFSLLQSAPLEHIIEQGFALRKYRWHARAGLHSLGVLQPAAVPIVADALGHAGQVRAAGAATGQAGDVMTRNAAERLLADQLAAGLDARAGESRFVDGLTGLDPL